MVARFLRFSGKDFGDAGVCAFTELATGQSSTAAILACTTSHRAPSWLIPIAGRFWIKQNDPLFLQFLPRGDSRRSPRIG